MKTINFFFVCLLLVSINCKTNSKLITTNPDHEWLPNLPNYEDITIEMLLQHRSGLPRYVLKPAIWDALAANPDKVWTYKDRLSYVFNNDAVHAAGESWVYSDTNYILLGMLIVQVTGKAYYDLARSNIFKKAGLQNTFPAITKQLPRLAARYSKLPASFKIPAKLLSMVNMLLILTRTG